MVSRQPRVHHMWPSHGMMHINRDVMRVIGRVSAQVSMMEMMLRWACDPRSEHHLIRAVMRGGMLLPTTSSMGVVDNYGRQKVSQASIVRLHWIGIDRIVPICQLREVVIH
jgi:hypothetical protein